MRAVQIEKPFSVNNVEINKPEFKGKNAIIKIHAAGICGSDIGALRGTNNLVSYPRIIGHELAGEIVYLPEDEKLNPKNFKIGDRVVVDPYLYCGHCYPCSIGRTNCCEDLKVLGVHVDGGMCEYFSHPANMLVAIPEEIKSWSLASMSEPLCIGLHGVHRGKVKEGETLVIFGAGTIGLMAGLVAKSYGATPILVDVVDERLEKAKELGIEHTINSMKEDLVETIKKYNNNELAHCVIEASGANACIKSSFEIVRNAGRIVLTGWPKTETPLATDIITKKEIDVRGGRTAAGEFEEALDLIAKKKIPMEEILTKTITLEEAPACLLDIEKNPSDYLKVVVEID